ncbi:GNAT family N-acetyltransferase [Sinomicrobium weinanense]|uniref:GNAT family N-acetyltransferase n=1 Tax=Sinomicrobium weinanense TaxID=2842200 RepID=A0A926JQ86_9FLAO|nr:GNAT family N-acetyltransferase [Sinomicrobium weinanense]MBC9795485.1 GNAT family N-acetyltransferase [Sinomicrobium weinanense]MBU3123368.1 GNAT family N-acetyltransferase [Sinomicrobium weinanense]
MSRKLTYTAATPEDHELLTRTARTSKQYWGYADHLMKLWQEELTISPDYITRNDVIKIEGTQGFIGFYALVDKEKGHWEVDHFWLLPDYIRKGYGTRIFEHILKHIKEKGGRSVSLASDPHAKGFYDKMGGSVIQREPSKVPGRFLDVYEFRVKKKDRSFKE